MLYLIETICYEHGELQSLDLHDERINRSRNDLFGLSDELHVNDFIQVPLALHDQKVKVRITYSTGIDKIEYEKYSFRPIQSLKLIKCDDIEYGYKYADRTLLNKLFRLKEDADDILIIKEGFITDTSHANIVLFKDGIWVTPSNPLLKGTRRESYLRSGRLTTALIRPEDLDLYTEARIINAMISFEQSPAIPITNIFW